MSIYRLEAAGELDELGLWELAGSEGVMAVEWLSRFPAALPGDRLHLDLSLLGGPLGARGLHARALGPRSEALLARSRAGWGGA